MHLAHVHVCKTFLLFWFFEPLRSEPAGVCSLSCCIWASGHELMDGHSPSLTVGMIFLWNAVSLNARCNATQIFQESASFVSLLHRMFSQSWGSSRCFWHMWAEQGSIRVLWWPPGWDVDTLLVEFWSGLLLLWITALAVALWTVWLPFSLNNWIFYLLRSNRAQK